MKSRIFALILALCCLSLLLVACDDEACVDHIDADNDLTCDSCGATLYVSTTEPENETEAMTSVDNHTHVDKEPADEYCDICGKNIVMVFRPSEPEEEETRVEMEVLTAPSDADPMDFIDLGEPKQPVSSMETETEGIDFETELKGTIVWVKEEVTEIVTDENSFYEEETEIKVSGTRYNVMDLLTGEKVIPTTTIPSIDFEYPVLSHSAPHDVTIDVGSFYFIVTRIAYSSEKQTVEGDDPAETTVYSVSVAKTAYTYSGIQIARETWEAKYDDAQGRYVSKDGTDFTDLWKLEEYDDHSNPAYAFFTYDGSIHLINKTSNEILPGGNALTFVNRPTFNYTSDAFGYVRNDNTLYAYDLSQWLECVYTYTIPNYYVDPSLFLLENGSMLLQADVQLPDDAVSFDYRSDDAKYDIVYVLIDPAAKTATEIEFGYRIKELVTGEAVYTEKATNVFVVHPIKQSIIDNSHEMILAVDNNMNVLCELPDLIRGSNITPFVNGYMFMKNDILDCYEILDSRLGFVTYVPIDAEFHENFFRIDGKLYTVANGEIRSLDAVLEAKLTGEYVIDDKCPILTETIEIPPEVEGDPSTTEENYYLITVDTNGFKLTKIGKENADGYEVYYEATDFGYITKVYIYDDESLEEGAIDDEASFLNFYNEKGEKIGSTRYDGITPNSFQSYTCKKSDGVYTLTLRYLDAEYNYQSLTYVVQ